MILRALAISAAMATLSGCNTVNFNERVGSVTVNNPGAQTASGGAPSATRAKQSSEGFQYLSKLTLTQGPCPNRDPSSYGLLMKTRTKVTNGNIVCYYN